MFLSLRLSPTHARASARTHTHNDNHIECITFSINHRGSRNRGSKEAEKGAISHIWMTASRMVCFNRYIMKIYLHATYPHLTEEGIMITYISIILVFETF